VFDQVVKPYHNLFTEESFAAMKKMDMEEEEENAKAAEEAETAQKDLETTLEENLEAGEDELVEAVENYGQVDEDDADD
jgi:GTPase involved in cell partitioning and DNA repair